MKKELVYDPKRDGNLFEWVLRVAEEARRKLAPANQEPLPKQLGRRL